MWQVQRYRRQYIRRNSILEFGYFVTFEDYSDDLRTYTNDAVSARLVLTTLLTS